MLDMLRAGAMSYVRKGVPADELTRTLHESLEAHARLADEPADA